MNLGRVKLDWIALCFLINFLDFLNIKLSVSALTSQEFYKDCEHRICFGTNEDGTECVSKQDCYVATSLLANRSSKSVSVNIIGKLSSNKGWISTGFSYDNLMGDDICIICEKSETKTHFLSKTDAKWNIELPQDLQSNLQLLQHSLIGNELLCEFTLSPSKIKIDDKLTFDLTKGEFYLLLALGPVAADDTLKYHTFTAASGRSLDLTVAQSLSSAARDRIMKKTHGILMVYSFMFLITAASHVARFYKESFVSLTIIDRRLWFLIHVGFMCTAVGLAFCAIVIIFVDRINMGKTLFPEASSGPLKNHAFVGLSAFSIMIFQASGMWYKPENLVVRKILIWLHSYLGILCLWLGWYCITFSYSDTLFGSSVIFILGIVHICLHIVFLLAMTILQLLIDCNSDETEGQRYRALYKIPIPRLMFEEPPYRCLRIGLLILDISVFFILATLTTVFISNYK